MKTMRKTNKGKSGSGKVRRAFVKVRLYVVIFLFLLALGLNSYAILRRSLLQNAQELGTSLARGYAAEESSNLVVFATLISFGTLNLNQLIHEESRSTQEQILWLQEYFKRLQAVVGENVIDPYAVVDGQIVAANPWEGDEDYEYERADWYRMATEADGEIIFTDVYTDVIYGRSVLTIAQESPSTGVVIAFDIFPENFQLESDVLSLPEGFSLYMCDKNGTLVWYETNLKERSPEEIQSYVSGLAQMGQRGELDEYDVFVLSPDLDKRAAYYHEMSNGWQIILTVPYDTLLGSLERFSTAFFFIMLAGLLAIVFIAWRDLRLNGQIERTNETIRVLGNSYYALYRVNCARETYEMIKGSDYVRSRIPQTGSYEQLCRVMSEVIEKDALKEFMECFSLESIQRLVKNRVKDFGGDFRRRFGDTYHWVNIRVLFDESLLPEEAVLCFREVDQEKKLQFEERSLLENALENARNSEKTKQAFFSNMSHDMRTPLNAITSLAELAQTNIGDQEKVADYLAKIRFSSGQLLNLVNDILDMSRLEQGKIALDYREFNLRRSLEDITAAFRLQAEREEKRFSTDFEIHNERILGDNFRISQILNNLLSNAFKFTGKGGEISLQVKEFESMGSVKYQFVVRDTGLGMSEEFLPHLFEPYARETRFTAQKISGTGLGMSIVENLVKQMSGQIDVKSRLGEGTEFTVTVPFAVAEEEENADKAACGDAAGKEEVFSLEGRKVLLAEDNLINMEIATEILTMHGVEVIPAENGLEALEAFQASAPFSIDAILMDMQMPQMDGCEATKRIRSLHRPDSGLPIIAVTANAFAEDIAETSKAGMDAHISKPIDFNILCRTLETLISGKRP